MAAKVANIGHDDTGLFQHFTRNTLFKRLAYLNKAGNHGVHTIAMAWVLRQQNLLLFTYGNNNAGKNTRIVQGSAIVALHCQLLMIEIVTPPTLRTKSYGLAHMAILHRFACSKKQRLIHTQ
ncbi:Uncharacterised protein [Vibrio cholerae]|uniref:Uncharacterized protein n=1 Tax=Vibrio cholerae TaxID=666 RepID=A0A655X5L0_VIBCL|nr:Uncharacterised protein [Vibrio cholerae]CSB10417.1 Uncharacterised protein [Vibrio cholerae]CSB12441.1 Uncharacterised protein [Vibrio cholerae]CSC04300.1 Uncharacterised protein [Vibrio cholerae]CSC26690.1 Uncharacterised protein [Vibrio cholerae]